MDEMQKIISINCKISINMLFWYWNCVKMFFIAVKDEKTRREFRRLKFLETIQCVGRKTYCKNVAAKTRFWLN